MKSKTEQSFASSLPASPVDQSAGFIVSHERLPGSPLSDQSRRQLDALAKLDDGDIDYSDIPPLTDDFLRNAVRGWLPLERHSVTLALDSEVYEWVSREGQENACLINHVLRREMQQAATQREQAASEARPEGATMSKAS